MIKAVFFDVANTLLQKPAFLLSVAKVLDENGIKCSLEELELKHKIVSEISIFPDKTSKDFYHQYNADFFMSLGILPTEKLLDDVFKACSYLPWMPFEDTEILQSLNLPMGILSNWDGSLKDKLTQYFPVQFHWVIGSFDSGIRKPELGFYQQAIDLTGYLPEEIVYVGDSIRLDILPAKKLGMKAILIDRAGVYPFSDVERIYNLSEITRYL